jgi:hypothetical protein
MQNYNMTLRSLIEPTAAVQRQQRIFFLGVFVTREHVRHNKSGITHRGKTRISH